MLTNIKLHAHMHTTFFPFYAKFDVSNTKKSKLIPNNLEKQILLSNAEHMSIWCSLNILFLNVCYIGTYICKVRSLLDRNCDLQGVTQTHTQRCTDNRWWLHMMMLTINKHPREGITNQNKWKQTKFLIKKKNEYQKLKQGRNIPNL